MTKRKKLPWRYGGGRIPKTYLPAHNHVMHTPETKHGTRGFRRFWISPQLVGHGWVKCPCGWRASSWGDVHYALSGHAKNWQREIKKRGSLEAVYRHINRQLARYERKMGGAA